MIYSQHNDGGCFSLKFKYMLDPGDGLSSEKQIWADDFNELLEHLMNEYKEIYVYDAHIFDDSK